MCQEINWASQYRYPLVPIHKLLLFGNRSLLFRTGTGFLERRQLGNFFKVCEQLSQAIQKQHRPMFLPPLFGFPSKVNFAIMAGQRTCFCPPSPDFVYHCTLKKVITSPQIHCFQDKLLTLKSVVNYLWQKMLLKSEVAGLLFLQSLACSASCIKIRDLARFIQYPSCSRHKVT